MLNLQKKKDLAYLIYGILSRDTIGSTKKKLWRVIGLALCALPPLYSAYVLYFRESWAWRFYPKELRDNFSQTLIISLGVGVCYALAAFCSYFVGGGKSRVKSQDTSSLDNFLKFENTNTVSSLSAKTFEPVHQHSLKGVKSF